MKKNVKIDPRMQKLHQTAMLSIAALMKKGYSNSEAESMVLTTLKESDHYLKNGMINETITCLKMIYLDLDLLSI
jgi:hypothetical protein